MEGVHCVIGIGGSYDWGGWGHVSRQEYTRGA